LSNWFGTCQTWIKQSLFVIEELILFPISEDKKVSLSIDRALIETLQFTNSLEDASIDAPILFLPMKLETFISTFQYK